MSQILLNCTHRRFMVFRTYMIIRHIYLNSYHWLILCPYHRESNLYMGKYPCAWYIYIIKVIMSSLDCFSPLILCHPVLQGVKLFKRPTYQHRPVNFVTVSWGATMRQLILSSGCRGDYHQPWDGAVFKERLVTDSLLLFRIYKINIYICCCSIVPYVTYRPCFSFFSCSSVCIM